MEINYNGLIMRKLTQCSRWSIEGNKVHAKEKFDQAWALMREAEKNNVKLEDRTVSAIFWLRDNYYEVKAHRYQAEPKWMQRKFEEMEADHAGL